MKHTLFLLTFLLLTSCATTTTTKSTFPEDELFITRKYVGQFISNSDPGNVKFGDVPIITVKTTIDTFDTIKVYAKSIKAMPMERLYIRKTWHSQGGYWYFILEAGKRNYRICEFGYGNKLLTQSWY